MTRITFKRLQQLADAQNMTADKYNPGDNFTVKILDGRNQDYFSSDGLARFKSIKEAYAYLQGFTDAKYLLVKRSLPKLENIQLPGDTQ